MLLEEPIFLPCLQREPRVSHSQCFCGGVCICDKCRVALSSCNWHLVWEIKLKWSPVKFVVIEDGCNDDDFHLWVSRCFVKVHFNTITWFCCCCYFSYISGLPVMKRILLFFILAAAVMYGILHGNLWRNNLYWYGDVLFTCADTLMAMWEMWLWAAVSLNSCLLVINRSHYYSVCFEVVGLLLLWVFCLFGFCEFFCFIVLREWMWLFCPFPPFSCVAVKPSSQFEPGWLERSGPWRQWAPLNFVKIGAQVRREILFVYVVCPCLPQPDVCLVLACSFRCLINDVQV